MYLQKPIYLKNFGQHNRHTNPLHHITNMLFISLIIDMNYLIFFHDNSIPPPPITNAPNQTKQKHSIEPKVTPKLTPKIEPIINTAPKTTTIIKTFKNKLKKNNTIFATLIRKKLEQVTVTPILTTINNIFDFRKTQINHSFKKTIDNQNKILTFEFQTKPLNIHQISIKNNKYITIKKNIPINRRTITINYTVNTSLFTNLTQYNKNPNLTTIITNLFTFDINFFQKIRHNDIVHILINKVYINKHFLKYNKMKTTIYKNKFNTYTTYNYKNKNNKTYYTKSNHTLRKEFLKTPLKYTQISSKYTHQHFHPTLHR